MKNPQNILEEANIKTRPGKPDRGRLHLQSTGALGAQVALLQSPIPPTAPIEKHKLLELSGTMMLEY